MLRRFGEHTVWLTVPSAGRPDNVGPMTQLIGPATWYAPKHEWSEYDATAHGIKLAIGDDRTVIPARNRALDDGWKLDCPVVMIDDDLRRVMKLLHPKQKTVWWKDPENLRAVLTELIDRTLRSPFYLGGVAPTDNPYFSRHHVTERGFVRSGVMCVKPCALHFDTHLRTKEDYDYTLQHVSTFGGVNRCDDLLFDFQQLSHHGGYAHTRTRDDKSAEYEAITHLEQKWGTVVRRNSRRPGEILLRFPRRQVLV